MNIALEQPVEEEPIAWEAAEAASRASEEKFEKGDVDGLVAKYDDEVIVRFATLPEIRGREQARAWLKKRLLRQKNYKLKKTVLAIDGQKVTRSWTADWIDSVTGKKMEGRGLELLEYRHGKLVLWDACFHVWEDGKRAESEYFDPA